MQLSMGTACSNPAGESPLSPGVAWTRDSCESCPSLCIRFRGLAWSIALSIVFWVAFLVAGHLLWRWKWWQ